jgi:hypothetical protein
MGIVAYIPVLVICCLVGGGAVLHGRQRAR